MIFKHHSILNTWISRLLFLPLFLGIQLPPTLAESPPLERIAFGSCADQRLPQPIWNAIFAFKPELFIFAGDNVYGDVSSADMIELKQAYATAGKLEAFQQLRSSDRNLATWDDHDFGINDGGGDFPYKELAKTLFLDFWRIPEGDPRRSRPGIYYEKVFGPQGKQIQIILLDTRSFRSALKPTDEKNVPGKERYLPDPDPNKTLLGEAQWQWLERQLEQPAQVRLIVSSIQVIAEGHGWERWGNLPLERERLFELLRRTQANGVIFLSGDRHLAALYREIEGVSYPIYEITSSSLNRPNPNTNEVEAKRLGTPYGEVNFGTVEIDWEQGTIILSVRAVDGSIVRQQRFSLSQLTASQDKSR
jgi:alkaline phosphatase D